MIPIAVLASGRGSNFEAILKSIREKKLAAEIVAVLSDRREALILEKAGAAGLKTLVVAGVKGMPKPEHDEKVIEALAPLGPKFLVMAGYMRVVTEKLLENYRSERGYTRITNIHPSLLPAFPGMHSYAQAFRHGAKITGATVHLVEAEVDCGPICAQSSFDISGCRSPEEVEQLGLKVEHRLYSDALSWILPEKFSVETREGRLCVSPN